MANTPTTKHGLLKPDFKDGRWDVPTNDNWDKVDDLVPPVGGESAQVLAKASAANYDYQWVVQSGGGGGSLSSEYKDASFDAVKDILYVIDTSLAPVTITLPPTPSVDDSVYLADYAGAFSANTCTVNRNGLNIMGLAENMDITTDNVSIQLIYLDAVQGWRMV